MTKRCMEMLGHMAFTLSKSVKKRNLSAIPKEDHEPVTKMIAAIDECIAKIEAIMAHAGGR